MTKEQAKEALNASVEIFKVQENKAVVTAFRAGRRLLVRRRRRRQRRRRRRRRRRQRRPRPESTKVEFLMWISVFVCFLVFVFLGYLSLILTAISSSYVPNNRNENEIPKYISYLLERGSDRRETLPKRVSDRIRRLRTFCFSTQLKFFRRKFRIGKFVLWIFLVCLIFLPCRGARDLSCVKVSALRDAWRPKKR